MQKERLNLNLYLSMALLASFFFAFECRADQQTQPAMHTGTDWRLEPSLKFDALCLLNALSGDPYYLEYYQAEYDRFKPQFTPKELAAFASLKKILKDEAGGIISANLALYFSATEDQTLDEMIRTAKDSRAMESALQKTSYWDADGWKVYEHARPDLEQALRALKRIGFDHYWQTDVKPKVDARIAEFSTQLPRYNIIPAIEARLGHPLASNRIVVYLLTYSEPHGIRITGTRFLTHISYPLTIVLRNAIHEMMHPPYDAHDSEIAATIQQLGKEPMLKQKIENHDRSFGYNSVEGYVEEDCVQSLEQIISEEFGVGRKPAEYWREQDGGIHVLAVALYARMKEDAARGQLPPFPQWLVAAVRSGRLRGAQLQAAVDQILATPH